MHSRVAIAVLGITLGLTACSGSTEQETPADTSTADTLTTTTDTTISGDADSREEADTALGDTLAPPTSCTPPVSVGSVDDMLQHLPDEAWRVYDASEAWLPISGQLVASNDITFMAGDVQPEDCGQPCLISVVGPEEVLRVDDPDKGPLEQQFTVPEGAVFRIRPWTAGAIYPQFVLHAGCDASCAANERKCDIDFVCRSPLTDCRNCIGPETPVTQRQFCACLSEDLIPHADGTECEYQMSNVRNRSTCKDGYCPCDEDTFGAEQCAPWLK